MNIMQILRKIRLFFNFDDEVFYINGSETLLIKDRAFFQAIPPGTEHTGVINRVLIGHELSGIGQDPIFVSQTEGDII